MTVCDRKSTVDYCKAGRRMVKVQLKQEEWVGCLGEGVGG